MWILLLVTCLNWIAWFRFLLFDTDWMGKEVYGGEVGKGHLYDMGVRASSLGLMLNSIVLGLMSLGIVYLVRRDRANLLWGVVNFLLAICLVMTVLVTKLAQKHRHASLPPPAGIKASALLNYIRDVGETASGDLQHSLYHGLRILQRLRRRTRAFKTQLSDLRLQLSA
ncbi:hypothetical protein ACLB2K_048519 [Fragaria x ananassa]